MTRDELNTHINDIKHCPTGMFGSIIIGWLEDIRDNGITESKKYRILIKHIENSYFELWVFYEGDGVFNTVSDKAEIATVKSFTKTQIEGLKKNDDIAIDWNKAIIEQVEDE